MEERNMQVEFNEEIENILNNYGKKSQDGVKEALRYTQEVFKCVSKQHQKQIADLFDVDIKIITTLMKLTPSLKDSIVEHEVICCTGRRCASNGSVEVIKAVKKSLGLDFNETSEDGKVRLTSQNCFKKCNMGPNIMIDGEFYHYMSKDKVIEVLNKEVLKIE